MDTSLPLSAKKKVITKIERRIFIEDFNFQRRGVTRVICGVVIFALLSFSAWDALVMGADHPRLAEFIVNRYAIGMPLTIAVFILSFSRSRSLRIDWLMTLAAMAICVSATQMYFLFFQINKQLAIEGMLLLTIGTYFLPNNFWYQKLLIGLFCLVSYFVFLWLTERGMGAFIHAGVYLGFVNIAGTIHSITFDTQLRENFKNQRTLEKMVRTDQLTGVDNRYRFDEEFSRLLVRAAQEGQTVGLAITDIDHFKQYNDIYGHLEGDECLVSVAQALHSLCEHETDRCIRFGGEEFILVKYGVPFEQTSHWANDILQRVRALKIPHQASSTGDFVTVSVGAIVWQPGCSAHRAELMSHADAALYQAKQEGRNRAVVAELPPKTASSFPAEVL